MPSIPAPHNVAPARPPSPDHGEDRALAQVRHLRGELAAQRTFVVAAHLDAMQQPARQRAAAPPPAATSLEDGIRAIVAERAQLHYFAEIAMLALRQFDRLETLTTNVLDAMLDPHQPLPDTSPPQDLGVGLRLSVLSADRQRSRLVSFCRRMQVESASVEADFRGVAERLGRLRLRPEAIDHLTSVAEGIEVVDEGRQHVARLAEAHRLAACRLSQLDTDARQLIEEEQGVLRAYRAGAASSLP